MLTFRASVDTLIGVTDVAQGSPADLELLTRLPSLGLGGRRKRRPERHDEILLAAVDLFHTKGYHATSVEEIASEVGVSATAVYRHFRNKQEILDTAALWINEQLVERLLATTADNDREALLEGFVDDLIDAALTKSHFVGMFVRELHSLSPAPRDHCLAKRREYVARWCEALVASYPTVSLPEAHVRVDLVITLICAIASRPDRDRIDAARLVKNMSMAALTAGASADGARARKGSAKAGRSHGPRSSVQRRETRR